MTDVVGLYLNPPQQAIVLCVDEKSQIQALDRTQPGLPLKKGRCGTMTHDYKRNGTTTLFAAMDTLQGRVVGECHQRHRHQEFLKFLRRLDMEFPGKVPLHLIMDNYGTHKHEKVREWLKRHPRFVPHFVPYQFQFRLNLVERWFGHLDSERNPPRCLSQCCRPAVIHLKLFSPWHGTWTPKPFVWTATVESIRPGEAPPAAAKPATGIQPGCTSPKTRKRKVKICLVIYWTPTLAPTILPGCHSWSLDARRYWDRWKLLDGRRAPSTERYHYVLPGDRCATQALPKFHLRCRFILNVHSPAVRSMTPLGHGLSKIDPPAQLSYCRQAHFHPRPSPFTSSVHPVFFARVLCLR